MTRKRQQTRYNIMIFNISFGNFLIAHDYEETPLAKTNSGEFYHTTDEIFLFLKGSGEIIIETKKYSLSPGTIIYIPSGTYHELKLNQENSYEGYIIKFKDNMIPQELLPNIKKMSGCYEAEQMIISLFLKLDDHIQHYAGDCSEGLFKTMLNVILYYFCSKPKMCDYKICNSKILNVIDYINENIINNFTLEDVCKDLKFSESSICIEFQRTMKTTVMKYVRMKRILLAESLINQGHKPTDIYKDCGFADYSTFFRTYKIVLGQTPSMKAYNWTKNSGDFVSI